MAAAQNLELTLDMVVKNQGAIATLFKQIGKLKEQVEKLEDATGGAEDAVRKMGKTVRGGTNPIDALSKSARQNRQAMQMAGMQVGDFATQISTGSNPVQAFNQQIGQLGYALSTSATPALQKIGSVLAGPWSIAILGATMLLGQMWQSSEDTTDAQFDLTESLDFSAMSASELTRANELLAISLGEVEKESYAAKEAIVAVGLADLESAKAALTNAQAQVAKIRAAAASGPSQVLKGGERGLLAGGALALESGFGELQTSIDLATQRLVRFQGEARITRSEMSELDKLNQDYKQSLNNLSGVQWDSVDQMMEMKDALDATYKPMIEAAKAAEDAAKAVERGTGSQREANEAKRKAIKLSEQIVKANVSRAKSLDTLTDKMKNWEEATTPKSQKPKTYTEVLDTLAKIETLDIPLPPVLDAILKKNAEIQKSYEAIGNAVANGFKGMITGAQSFGSAMKGIIQSVIDELFRLYVVQQIVGFVTSALGGAFGGGAAPAGGGGTGGIGGFRALGGSVSANTPYVVGEKGPELFMPSKSGTIIPNQNLPSGGGSTFNISVDARGSTDPEAVRQQVQQGILEAAPSIVAAAQNRTMNTLRRPRLAGAL